MSRKQFVVPASSHEKKLTKKERKAQLEEAQKNNQQMMQQVPQEEVQVTEEDTAQIKNLALYASIGIGLLLLLMYWIFING